MGRGGSVPHMAPHPGQSTRALPWRDPCDVRAAGRPGPSAARPVAPLSGDAVADRSSKALDDRRAHRAG